MAAEQKASPAQTSLLDRLLVAERWQWVLFVPVLLAVGILLWFGLPTVDQRRAALLASLAVALSGVALAGQPRRLVVTAALLAASGMLLAELRSTMVAGPRLHHRTASQIVIGTVEAVEPREGGERTRIRLWRDPVEDDPAHRIRLSLPGQVPDGVVPGARIAVRATLGPVPGPVLPGAHDGARRAWFQGVAASGRALGPVQLLAPPPGGDRWLDRQRSRLGDSITRRLPGDSGGLAVALVVGEQGQISPALLEAMRTAGLAHLLTVSGFHVGVVVGGVFLLGRRLLALSMRLALAFSVRTAAALVAGTAGTAYALLSGADVPAVRASIVAWVALIAIILGRDPLSLRLLGFAALLILATRPEALLGPSFQLSFAAVMAIILLADSPVGRWLKGEPGGEGLLMRAGRLLASLVLASLVVELVLLPIALAHFGRAGLYGVIANMAAIPLTAFVVMPLLGLWLALSLVGLEELVAWLLRPALDLLGAIGTTVSAWPGATLTMPAFPPAVLAVIAAGGLLLMLLRGPLRWSGAPLLLAGVLLALLLPRPSLYVSADGRQVGLVHEGRLHLLRGHREGFLVRSWQESASFPADGRFADLPGARCDRSGCRLLLEGGLVLMAFTRPPPDGRDLATACAAADILTAPTVLPANCEARWLTLDRASLRASGAVAIDPARRHVRRVADGAGDQPWSPAALPGWQPRLLGPPAWTGVIAN